MKSIIIFLSALCLLCIGCTVETKPKTGVNSELDDKILKTRSHKLDWTGHDPGGDQSKAEYSLDGLELGVGKKGIAELKRLIAKMPKGSDVYIVPYYGGKDPYPFDTTELRRYAKEHGVFLGIPKAK